MAPPAAGCPSVASKRLEVVGAVHPQRLTVLGDQVCHIDQLASMRSSSPRRLMPGNYQRRYDRDVKRDPGPEDDLIRRLYRFHRTDAEATAPSGRTQRQRRGSDPPGPARCAAWPLDRLTVHRCPRPLRERARGMRESQSPYGTEQDLASSHECSFEVALQVGQRSHDQVAQRMARATSAPSNRYSNSRRQTESSGVSDAIRHLPDVTRWRWDVRAPSASRPEDPPSSATLTTALTVTLCSRVIALQCLCQTVPPADRDN